MSVTKVKNSCPILLWSWIDSLTLKTCQVVWLAICVRELISIYLKLVKIYVDNVSTVELVKNLAFHSWSKHMKIRYHYMWKCVENREIEVVHILTKNNEQTFSWNLLQGLNLKTFRLLLNWRMWLSTIKIKDVNIGVNHTAQLSKSTEKRDNQ